VDTKRLPNLLTRNISPAGKVAEKAICRKVFWIIWHCIMSAELTKHALL